MLIGYSFWGYLGDYKFDEKGNEVGTPDGNAFYSWSIIKALIDEGHDVVFLQPDRDAVGYEKLGSKLFEAFAQEDRERVYLHCAENNKKFKGQQPDLCLFEWRWQIEGRNSMKMYKKCRDVLKNFDGFQIDYVCQDFLLRWCHSKGIPYVILDLDYKLTKHDIKTYKIKNIMELGYKHVNTHFKHVNAKHVEIPFDFSHINDFEVEPKVDNLVYVGNRYERDWCIDKYIPDGSLIYGNWNEAGRDSSTQWPNLKFMPRIAQKDMHKAYKGVKVTPLLAKKSYCDNGFMTARIIEAVFYGCVPLFIEEFQGSEKYIPEKYRESLIVRSKEDVERIANSLTDEEVKEIVNDFREHLKFMDAKYFVKELISFKNTSES